MRRESARAIYFGSMGVAALAVVAAAPAAIMGFTDEVAFQASTSDLVTEDFEEGPWLPPGPLTQAVENLGVSWTSPENLRTDTVVPYEGMRALFAADIAGDPVDEITADFDETQGAAGAWVGNAGNGNTVELLAYGVGGGFLGSATLDLTTSGLGEYRFLGLAVTEGEEIDYVVFRSIGGINDEFILDNFQFGASMIPGSSALGIFATALLLGRRRRRA